MGTEGPIWIRIIGTKDRKTGRQSLDLMQKTEFAPGSKETFSFEAFDVEEVRQIEVSWIVGRCQQNFKGLSFKRVKRTGKGKVF